MSLTVNGQQGQPLIAEKNTAIVPTTYGKLRGYLHNGVYTFKGIPYGKAVRFMPPEHPSSWEGIRSSMTYGPTCPSVQQDPFRDEFEFPLNRTRGYYIGENCLNLNIWSKKVNSTQKQPVMVWLHGGGFASGSAIEFPSYDGENLSRKGDVVVVSINHRLNALGFLDLSAYGDKYKHSANVGMMDILAALSWIKDNISNFGGDPDNITVFGQSGGGAKVTCLMNMPAAKGLFHKAIIQSGSYLTQFVEPAVSRRITAELLKELGLRPDQVDSLQTLSYEMLGAASEKALQLIKASLPEDKTGFGLEWGPVHDADLLPFQPDEPSAIRLSMNIPLLVGSCKNEYMPYIFGSRAISPDNDKDILQKLYGDKTAAYISAVKKAYPQTTALSDYAGIDLLFRPLVIRQANQRISAVAASAPPSASTPVTPSSSVAVTPSSSALASSRPSTPTNPSAPPAAAAAAPPSSSVAVTPSAPPSAAAPVTASAASSARPSSAAATSTTPSAAAAVTPSAPPAARPSAAAPTYVYLFAWQSPVLDGAYKAFHCMDLPFVFNNIARSEEMTGGSPQAYALADKVSEAWIQFARHGNPGHKGLPAWPAWSANNEATMIFDNENEVKNHFDKVLLSIGSEHAKK